MNDKFFSPPDLELSPSEHAARRGHLLREIRRAAYRSGGGKNVLRWRRRRLTLVAAAVLAMAVTASAIGVGVSAILEARALHRQIAERPLGQPVQVASGAGWSLVAWQSNEGLCLDLVVPGNGATACGIPVVGAATPANSYAATSPQHEVGYVLASGQSGQHDLAVGGVASADVRRVMLTLSDGQQIEAEVFDAPSGFPGSVHFFFADVPTSAPPGGSTESPLRSIDAYDESGRLLEHFGINE